MVNVYILLLEHKKFYIGKTTNPQFRIEQHFASNGSSWTKKYKPVSIVEVIPDCDEYDEDKHTIKYMEKYGIQFHIFPHLLFPLTTYCSYISYPYYP